MITSTAQIERLVEEWILHKNIIIAVDYDDTIYPWKYATPKDCDEVIDALKSAQVTGAYIVIFTACREDRYNEIKEYCKSKGLEINSINQNPIELPYGNQNKIYANIFIDDRAGLEKSLDILNRANFIIRGKKEVENALTQRF